MILPYHRFVPTYGRDEVPSRPKMLPYKIAFLLAVYSGQMDRTFTLDEPDHLRNRIFWRNRNHHVNVIRQMTFFDPAFLLLCQLAKHIPEVPPQLPVKRLPAALGNEHNMIFALLWLRLSYSSIVKLPFVCVVAHDQKFRRWATDVNVKLMLPPRQSRGSPGYARNRMQPFDNHSAALNATVAP